MGSKKSLMNDKWEIGNPIMEVGKFGPDHLG